MAMTRAAEMSAAGGTDVLVTLRALADPNRFRVFCALRGRERCVRDLVASEQMAQPLVSHHLRVLERAGLVTSRRAQSFTLYALDPAGLAAAGAALVDLLDPASLTAIAHPGGNPDCCR
ncbi:MAG: metalloregulator ArsR/SmtB family transcription factor [Actinobacteria bacterium]|nr:metalloregulator ArsR/SmtB family transcription factor [Actinomycetota bacterium]